MKKLLCIIAALAAACGSVNAVAADKAKGEPDVYVNGSRIVFDDVPAQIVDDVTLVPARGVFEAMGNKVTWNEEKRTVTVAASNNVRYAIITIDSNILKVKTLKSLLTSDDAEVELEVPAQIIGDRTMIPLRAVSEAFDSDVKWDGDAYCVNITTGAPVLMDGYTYKPEEDKADKMTLSIHTDAEEVTKDETFDVYIELKNMPEGYKLEGITGAFEYDRELFQMVGGAMICDDGSEYEPIIAVINDNYGIGAKFGFGTVEREKEKTSDGDIFKATFKKLTDKGGKITLGNTFSTKMSVYDTELIFLDGENKKKALFGDELLFVNNYATIK